ncbi:MAG: alpha-isopropylmalate synthase regulatory domain-containing protein [Mangrovibacterium sp.]
MNRLQIMDTTLRDGEQTSGVSFSASEKLSVVKVLLEDVRVDYVEVASARVSDGELEAAQNIMKWAADKSYLHRIEILGFVDGDASIDWVKRVGGKVLNLLSKGSLNHVMFQLNQTPQEHIENIKQVVHRASAEGLLVNLYLEDWSNGMINSKDYVHFLMNELQKLPIQRIMLPDTLGVLNPDDTYAFCKEMVDAYPHVNFDFHPHNDYDLAIANVYQALKAGVKCIHTTVNGLGERAGNAPLSSVVGVIKDMLKLELSINESMLTRVSRLVESFSGIRIPGNKPLVGEFVFTQCSGVHADGDNKKNLYFNALLPERFGRTRSYALGKTSGRANIKANLADIGVELSPVQLKMVTDRVIELADHKESVTVDDLPFIVADVLQERLEIKVFLENYALTHAKGIKPMATVCLNINGKSYEAASSGEGQYDAFAHAVKIIYERLSKPFPKLIDYSVSIPPGGQTDALVETIITWKSDREFKTRALDPDQTAAAIKATIRMLNMIEE